MHKFPDSATSQDPSAQTQEPCETIYTLTTTVTDVAEMPGSDGRGNSGDVVRTPALSLNTATLTAWKTQLGEVSPKQMTLSLFQVQVMVLMTVGGGLLST